MVDLLSYYLFYKLSTSRSIHYSYIQCKVHYSTLQTLPVAPLYGDVQIRFADWVRQLTHYDPQSGRAPANTRKRRPQWASRLEWRQSTLNTSASSQTSPDTTMRCACVCVCYHLHMPLVSTGFSSLWSTADLLLPAQVM